ncbi:TraI/MobA(P) family conjugative relaxase [Vibrio sp. L85]|uniref:TraI/MobA(P) family conjugative relaxase n=1 Tax=Vibrio sp. L85 TaxID=1769292 RepID=UPI0009A2AD26|nr:TraI/MobA(P) family conjugative relaxase [Vibrio sp. L85]EKO3821454.1 relaxase/mobilization nuclease domain-containing protein [Vibrio harveyi]
MIISEITAKKNKRTFSGLLNYMLDISNSGEKVDYLSISNCITDDIDLAALEIKMTQARNERTKVSKTMHLIVSFPVGEKPTREQMDDIEQTIAESVGMGTHQRISVAHKNTDNYHLHIAINRINQETYKAVNNYFYQRDMMRAREELEIKHGLERTIPGNEKENKLSMDVYANEKSFYVWCKESISDDLEAAFNTAKHWSDIELHLKEKGVYLKKVRNGLVLTDGEHSIGLSKISSKLSLFKMEKSLGEYRDFEQPSKASSYKRSNDELYKKYTKSKNDRAKQRAALLAELKQKNDQSFLAIRASNAIAKAQIKTSKISYFKRRSLYQQLATNYATEKIMLKQVNVKKRKAIYEQFGAQTFNDYLRMEAANGSDEALAKLRRDGKFIPCYLTGIGDRVVDGQVPGVDKNGHLVYDYKGFEIRDTGKGLICDGSDSAMLAMLKFGQLKYGDSLTFGDNSRHADIERIALGFGVHLEPKKTPIELFIDNRNKDRERIQSIEPHQMYRGEAGQFVFGGYRNMEDQSAILLRKGGIVYVKEIERKSLSKYKSMKVGKVITLGRSRDHDVEVEL